MDAECVLCHLQKNIATARSLGDEATAAAFAKDLMRLHLDAPADAGSPYLGPGTNALFQKYYGIGPDRYRQEKIDSNQFVMDRFSQICQRVEAAEDPVLAAVQFAILGNYLDFSALRGNVSFEKLDEMLSSALEMELDMQCYAALCSDLARGKSLLLLTDNAGEIGFDRILAEQIQKAYPHLQITVCVRGQITQNDATREDAQTVGMPFPIIDNGNAVAGTEISQLSPEAKTALETADVVIAKGMGNTETMFGCGYNVYYLFLVKCGRFVRFFNKPLMTPMLVREKEQ